MYKEHRHLTVSTYRRGPRTYTRTHKYPKRRWTSRSLFEVSSSREDELETRGILDLSTSCGLRRSGSAGLEPATTMPLQVPGTEDQGRTPTSTREDKAASTSRQGEAIPDDPAGKPQLPANPNSLQSDRAKQLFTPRPGGRGLPLVTRPPPLTGRVWHAIRSLPL